MDNTVDVEDESLLSSLFKDKFPDAWKSNPDFAQYLSELSSYGLNKLNAEPERLAEERAQILQETQDLAFHNYKTFIETADCSRKVFKDFQVIETYVQSMLDKFPQLFDECNKFIKTAQEINTSRRNNNLTLQRHTQLLEVLEMPQLMDTCVRNGYYEEALELATHVRRLERKHSTIPAIANIVNEVKSCCQLMLQQLIQQLRTNVQLPTCLRVIGYLRRMDVFTETELRIKFLQARDAWFNSVIDAIPKEDAYYHITKTIESSRVHLFDIMTQYRAIFSDDDVIGLSKDETPNDNAIFHAWVVKKVTQFLATLESDLASPVGPRLDSVLGQAMYFGLSFSRVGADFRGLLAPIFINAARDNFRKAVQSLDDKFEDQMNSFTLLGHSTALPTSAYTVSSKTGTALQPPVSLLEVPPLAVYCNGLLVAFNDLRLCAPLAIADDVSKMIEKSLGNACRVILLYHKAEESTLNDNEHKRFQHMCTIFCEELCPFINNCIKYIFPPAQLAQVLGLTLSQLQNTEIASLNVGKITEGLQQFLPTIVIDTSSEEKAAHEGETDYDKQIELVSEKVQQAALGLDEDRPTEAVNGASVGPDSASLTSDSHHVISGGAHVTFEYESGDHSSLNSELEMSDNLRIGSSEQKLPERMDNTVA